jgi:hypothetical protein
MTDKVVDPSPAIPEFLAAMAVKHGVPTDKVPDEWADYSLWSETKYPGLGLGGQSWLSWCKRAAGNYAKLKLEDRVKLEHAAAERAARLEVAREVEAHYEKSSVTFGEYCALLERRECAGELLEAHEASVVRFWEQTTQAERGFEARQPLALFGRFVASIAPPRPT